MRGVTTAAKSASGFAQEEPVLQEPSALLPTTEKTVAADSLCKEMGLATAKNVRGSLLHFFKCFNSSIFSGITPEEPECYIDSDCREDQSCYQEHCQDLCRTRNPCQGNYICKVVSNQGKRTISCACPEGFVAASPTLCEQGKFNLYIQRLGVDFSLFLI